MSEASIKRSKWSRIMAKPREKIIVSQSTQNPPSDRGSLELACDVSLLTVVHSDEPEALEMPLVLSETKGEVSICLPKEGTDMDETPHCIPKEEDNAKLEFDVTDSVHDELIEPPLKEENINDMAHPKYLSVPFPETLESEDEVPNENNMKNLYCIPEEDIKEEINEELNPEIDDLQINKNDENVLEVSESPKETAGICLRETVNSDVDLKMSYVTPDPVGKDLDEHKVEIYADITNAGDTYTQIPSEQLKESELNLELLNKSSNTPESNMESEDRIYENLDKSFDSNESGGSNLDVASFDRFVLDMSLQEPVSDDDSSDLQSIYVEEYKGDVMSDDVMTSPLVKENLTFTKEAEITTQESSPELKIKLEVEETQDNENATDDNDMQLDVECIPIDTSDAAKEIKNIVLTDFQLLQSYGIKAADTPKIQDAIKILKEVQKEAQKLVTDYYSTNNSLTIFHISNLLDILELIPDKEVKDICGKLKALCDDVSEILLNHSMQEYLNEADELDAKIDTAWLNEINSKIQKYIDALLTYEPEYTSNITCITCQEFITKEIETKPKTAEKCTQAGNNDYVMVSKTSLQEIQNDMKLLNNLIYEMNKKLKTIAPFLIGEFVNKGNKYGKNVSRDELLSMRYLPESLETPTMRLVPEIVKDAKKNIEKQDSSTNADNLSMPTYRTNQCSFVVPMYKKFEYVSSFH